MPEGKHLQALKRKGWEIVHVEDDRYFVLQLAQEVLVFDTKRDIPYVTSPFTRTGIMTGSQQ